MRGRLGWLTLAILWPLAAGANLDCPPSAPVGGRFPIEIVLDVGARPLGAYSVVVTYDPVELRLDDIGAGGSPEFDGAYAFWKLEAGKLRLAAFQIASLAAPTGSVSVAVLTFTVLARKPLKAAVALTPAAVFDTDAATIPATASSCAVAIGRKRLF